MGRTLTHAGGLEKELDERVPGRWTASDPRPQVRDNKTVTEREIRVDSKPIGTLTVRTYVPAGKTGTERVFSVSYEGELPGYIFAENIKHLSMQAFEFPFTEGVKKRICEIDYSEPNNTLEHPLYRHDFHDTLALADYESRFRCGPDGEDGWLDFEAILPRADNPQLKQSS